MHRCHHQCRHWSRLQESEGYPFKSQDWKTHGTMEALNRSGFQLWSHARSSSIFRHFFKFSSSRHFISISSSSMALALVDDVLSVRHSQCMNWPTMRSCKVGRREGIQTAVKDYIDANIVVLMDRCWVMIRGAVSTTYVFATWKIKEGRKLNVGTFTQRTWKHVKQKSSLETCLDKYPESRHTQRLPWLSPRR